MFRTVRWAHLIALVALAVLPFVSTSAFAASASSGIGVVDLQTVYSKYDAVNFAMQHMQALEQKLEAPMTILQLGAGLSDDDYKKYKNLKEQPAQDKATIDTLEQTAKKNVDTFQALDDRVQKNDKLSDDEQKQYDTLKKRLEAVQQQLSDMNKEARGKYESEAQHYQTVITNAITAAVEKSAKDQKLTLVLSKDAQVAKDNAIQVVLWNEKNVDITDKVVTELNASFKPAMFDETTTTPSAPSTNATPGTK